MKLFCDLHMHSCLSPCGHEDMTPNNIVGMAKIKGLDAIAVADHNSAKNLPAVQTVAEEQGILLLPALEVTTQEEVHVLCYFPKVDAACAFGEFLRGQLLDIPANPDFFGPQDILNAQDEKVDTESRLLAQATSLSIAELQEEAAGAGGLCVPAHINRGSNGMLGVLGMLPVDVAYKTVEVSRSSPPGIDLTPYLVLHASDAHQLGDIAEPDFTLSVEEASIDALLDRIRKGKKL